MWQLQQWHGPLLSVQYLSRLYHQPSSPFPRVHASAMFTMFMGLLTVTLYTFYALQLMEHRGAHKLCECHVTLPSPAPKKARNKLVLACLIALVFMTAEVIGKGMCAVCHVWSVPCVLCACYAGTWRITACTTFCHTLHKTRPQVWCVHVWCGVVGLVCYCVHT